jgi:hypothetical protein
MIPSALGDHADEFRVWASFVMPPAQLFEIRQIRRGEQAQLEGLCVKSSADSLRNAIVSAQWAPVYPSYL